VAAGRISLHPDTEVAQIGGVPVATVAARRICTFYMFWPVLDSFLKASPLVELLVLGQQDLQRKPNKI